MNIIATQLPEFCNKLAEYNLFLNPKGSNEAFRVVQKHQFCKGDLKHFVFPLRHIFSCQSDHF